MPVVCYWGEYLPDSKRLSAAKPTSRIDSSEVRASVITGLLNRQDAFDLRISEITVKTHRGRVIRKMRAESLADFVEMAMKLRLCIAPI